MTPEYVDASDLIQPDTRSEAQKWLDAEMDKRWANEQGAEPYPILESIALEIIEDNQRLRAQIGQGEPNELRMRTLLARYEKQWHRMGELWERCQGKGWPEAESKEFTRLRDELKPATRALLLAYAHPAPQQKPLRSEEIYKIASRVTPRYADNLSFVPDWAIAFARGIEAAHNIGEKK